MTWQSSIVWRLFSNDYSELHEKKVIYLHFTTTTSKQKEDEKEDKSYTAHGEKKKETKYITESLSRRGVKMLVPSLMQFVISKVK